MQMLFLYYAQSLEYFSGDQMKDFTKIYISFTTF